MGLSLALLGANLANVSRHWVFWFLSECYQTLSLFWPNLTYTSRLQRVRDKCVFRTFKSTALRKHRIMDPRVKLDQGTCVGRHYPPAPGRPRGLDIYLGIPYALSTAGEHRFRPARPISAGADGPSGKGKYVDAATLGFISPYTDAAAEPVPSGEDCLSVNVVVPSSVRERLEKEGEGAKVPVVVYFHGGAFNLGYGVDRDMPSFVAHAAEGTIAVSFNYRLGVLGFLPSASVVGKDGRESLNLGLGDQRLAMEWVRKNIGAFGGDQGRIGVMGISAGAHSVRLP